MGSRSSYLFPLALSLALLSPLGCSEDAPSGGDSYWGPFNPITPTDSGTSGGNGQGADAGGNGNGGVGGGDGDVGGGDGDGDVGGGDGDGDVGGIDAGGGDGDGDVGGGDGDAGAGDGDGDGDGDVGGGDGDGDGDVGGDGDGDGDVGGGDGDGDALPPLPDGKAYQNGWIWVEPEGAVCRDGSKAGYYHRKGTSNNVLIFLNGGGACADPFFCDLNPKNVEQDLPIEFLSHGTFDLIGGVRSQRQIAPEEGIFKRSDTRNPVRDWTMIYVPYCTGDIHSGTRRDVEIPGVQGKQQFVGYHNFTKFLESFGPSVMNAEKILLTGSSAGGFGSLFNADRTQEYFKNSKLITISDSGIPMQDAYMAPCLQKRWRDTWGLNEILPQDCTECFNADGGGLVKGYGDWLFHKKYKDRMLGGFISSQHDEIIRAFFAAGLSEQPGGEACTLDPGANTVASALGLGQYDGPTYLAGLKDVLDNVVTPEKVGYYVMTGQAHMHLWRPRFYEKNGNQQTIAEWVKDILDEKNTKNGSLQ